MLIIGRVAGPELGETNRGGVPHPLRFSKGAPFAPLHSSASIPINPLSLFS